MPQIQVNEIDQSVVTRVVTDDKVKVFCPIIASFGPGADGTDGSVKTFTDVTDFNRAFGYKYAEFNPMQDDYSRMYARELIKKGAAVSVVKINNGGGIANFKIEVDSASPRNSGSLTMNNVCPASIKSDSTLIASNNYNLGTVPAGTVISTSETLNANIVPGTIVLNVVESGTGNQYTVKDTLIDGFIYHNGKKFLSVNYSTGTIAPITSGTDYYVIPSGTTATGTYDYITGITDFTKYCFAPQIEGIQAKYTGSFGNDLIVAISQINTTRLAESFQYANITVYYVERQAEYDYDIDTETAVLKNQTVQSVRVLETKRISTNPNDPNYFEDVEFEFIKIIATENARQELSLVWSNIDADPISDKLYSGFPTVAFKYKPKNQQVSVYNTAAYMTGGSDFPYSAQTLAKLMSGFKGYTSASGNWTIADYNAYMDDVYGAGGIIETIYSTLSNNIYNNFTDPYIYDFDFITASGLTYVKYDLNYDSTSVTDEAVTVTDSTYTLLQHTNGVVKSSVSLTIDTDTTWTDNGNGGFVNGSTVVTGASINYNTGVITFPTGTYTNVKASYKYYDSTKQKVATPSIPLSVTNTDGGNYCFYTDVTPIHQAMRELVDTRQDCIALFDVPHDYDPMMIVDYSLALNTSYGTIHHPWCWVNSPDIAGKQIRMSPSYIFLYTFLSNLINNVDSQKWFPPAGVARATAKVVQRPDYEIGSVYLNEWQNDNIARVNPIMKLKQYGYVIYGQYTTLPAIDLYTHSALESLNVRLISNVVKKKIFDSCLNLAFEPNTERLWLKFFAQMDEFLRFMKYNQGVYDYRIVMDKSTVTTDDINHLRCPGKVFIAPTRTAEFFDIDFIITDAGAVFSE